MEKEWRSIERKGEGEAEKGERRKEGLAAKGEREESKRKKK